MHIYIYVLIEYIPPNHQPGIFGHLGFGRACPKGACHQSEPCRTLCHTLGGRHVQTTALSPYVYTMPASPNVHVLMRSVAVVFKLVKYKVARINMVTRVVVVSGFTNPS